MKILNIFLIIFFFINPSQLKSEEESYDLKNEILKNVRCLICQGQSVFGSDSDFALSIKIVVDRKIREGLKEEDIYKILKEKYGDWILYDPQLNKNTYILWILPMLLFVLGGAIIFKKLNIKK